RLGNVIGSNGGIGINGRVNICLIGWEIKGKWGVKIGLNSLMTGVIGVKVGCRMIVIGVKRLIRMGLMGGKRIVKGVVIGLSIGLIRRLNNVVNSKATGVLSAL
uniref:hypothetical protein n=1 Tax=Staphylococcus pasteuri TaxID=45972 RepID=UPI001649FB34